MSHCPSFSSQEPYRNHGPGIDEAEKPLVVEPNERSLPRHIDTRASQMRRRAAPNWIRIVLCILALGFALRVAALQANSVYRYLKTQHDRAVHPGTHGNTTVWPTLYKLPTILLLAASLVSTVFHLIALGTFCICCRSIRESMVHVWLAYISGIVTAALWIGVTVYYKIVDNMGASKDHWDVWSWTCYRKRSVSVVPWATLCNQNTYSYYGAIIVSALEVLALLTLLFSHKSFASVKKMYPGSGRAYRGI